MPSTSSTTPRRAWPISTWNRRAGLSPRGALACALKGQTTSGGSLIRLVATLRHPLSALPRRVPDGLGFPRSSAGSASTLRPSRHAPASPRRRITMSIRGGRRGRKPYCTGGASSALHAVNEIKVLPPSPMDDQVRRAVYRALRIPRHTFHSHHCRRPGHLGRCGANEADKNLCNLRASGVANVFSVTNDLQVEGK